jgi:5-formyltetrahydrofolate cyclo-ligase
MQKLEIRKKFQEQRSQLTKQEVRLSSQLINQNFIFNLLPKIYSNKAIFSLYLPINNEVETEVVASFFRKNNIKFSYPKIIAKDKPLYFVEASKNQEFSYNHIYKNVLEPKNSENNTVPNILIMPLVAFDENLYRLGMGGGFFDRTIANLKSQGHKIVTIGFAYDSQRFGGFLPVEKTDCRLDFIVLQGDIIRVKSMFS